MGTTRKQSKKKSIERKTSECVAKINKHAETELKARFEQGRLIKEYIEASDETKDALFERLASHPDCLIGKGQLRNLYEGYEVYISLADRTGIDHLPITYYSVLQSRKLTPYKREKLLREAVANEWSISELKEAIKEMLPPKPPPKSKSQMLKHRIEKMHSDLMGVEMDEAEDGDEFSELKNSLCMLFRLACSRGWIKAGEFENNQTREEA